MPAPLLQLPMRLLWQTTMALILLLCTGSMCVRGQSAEWTQPYGDSRHSSRSNLPLGGGQLSVSARLPHMTLPFQFLVHDSQNSVIFVDNSTMYCWDSDLDEQKWAFQLGDEQAVLQAAIGDPDFGNVYGATAGPLGVSELYAVRQGVSIFEVEVTKVQASSIWVAVDMQSSPELLYILSIQLQGGPNESVQLAVVTTVTGQSTGMVSYSFASEFELSQQTKSPCVNAARDAFFTLASGQTAYAFGMTRTAAVRWKVAVPGPASSASVDGITPDDHVFACAQLGQVQRTLVLDASNGTVRRVLNQAEGCFCGAMSTGTDILLCSQHSVSRVHYASGNVTWVRGNLVAPQLVLGSNDLPVVLSNTNTLLSLRTQTGAVQSRLKLADSTSLSATMSANDGRVYVNRMDSVVQVGCCNGHGACRDNGSCKCQENYFGPSCDTQCVQGHSCVNGQCNTSTGACECQRGFAGLSCTLSCSHNCGTHGHCATSDNVHAQCKCDADYYGSQCATHCTRAGSCNNRGVCNPANGQCMCDDNFYGPKCAQMCHAPRTCSGRGQCDPTGQCRCFTFSTGPNCEQNLVLPVFGSLAIVSVAAWIIVAHRMRQRRLDPLGSQRKALLDVANRPPASGGTEE